MERFDVNPAPAPGSFTVLGTTYQIDAGGASLLSPVTLVFPYDPLKIPAGKTAADLTVAYYDGISWTELSGTVDSVAHTITVSSTHFSIWAVVAKVQSTGRPSPPCCASGLFINGVVRRGESLCAYPAKPLADSSWQLFNSAGQRVSTLSQAGTGVCLDTQSLVPGVYYLRAFSVFSDGSKAPSLHKVVILP
jgi:hypothetical protein